MAGAIAQDRESCQFPFVLDEKPTVVPVGSGSAIARDGNRPKATHAAAYLGLRPIGLGAQIGSH